MLSCTIVFCSLVSLIVCFFFFKQKTAYEMRISDWSSDVCSSDLHGDLRNALGRHGGLVEEDAPEVIAVRKDLVLVGQIGPARIHQVNARQPIMLCDFLGPQVIIDGQRDRKSVVEGMSVSGRVDLGGRRILKKQTTK